MNRLGLAAALVMLATGAAAQEPRPLPPEAQGWSPRKGSSPVFGLGYQSPEGPQLSAGLVVGTVPGKQNKCIFGATSEGLLLQAHAGLKGAKVSAGAARYNPLVGYGAKVSALHLWSRSGDSPSGSTYVGPELEIALFMTRVSVGVLWPVAGPRGAARRFTWGIGLGF